MIVTTSGRTNMEFTNQAKEIAKSLHAKYLSRKKGSIRDIKANYHDDILIVGKNRLEVHSLENEEPLFFHPNSAMFRIKRLMKSLENDPFLNAVQLTSGMSFLDCTLGLGSDSIVASYLVGKAGRITSIEGNPILAYIVKTGLQSWQSSLPELDLAMRSINVQNDDYGNYLKGCQSDSFDVVYFDPMFEEAIAESNGIQGIKPFAIYSDISEEVISEATRVATKRIVVKTFWKSSESFEKLGFTIHKRTTAKFHYGLIELS